ncbi:MAG: hypothetical protein IT261_06575 [Saprospiraceae bacterium]|nr:hypothetical protein [Saprospiraceae bacterium]
MKRKILLVLAVTFNLALIHAQTPKENLEKAVENYNGTRTLQDGFSPKTLTDADIAIVKSRMDQGLALLDKVMLEGNADQIKVARYFKTNFRYAYFFTLGMKGRNADAYEFNKLFEADMLRYSEADFPMSYDFFEKKYTIKWENFSTTQAEYLTGFGEICYNLGKNQDAVRFAKLALNHSGVSPYLKYIAVNKILDAYGKDNSVITRTEYLDYALSSVQLYDQLDTPTKETVKENNYPTTLKGSNILKQAFESDKSPAHLTRVGTAAPIAARYEKTKGHALDMFDYCYRNNYNGTESFHTAALELAKEQFPLGTSTTRQAYQNLGDKALTVLVGKIYPNECEKYGKFASDYKTLGLSGKGLELEKKQAACIKKREEDNKRREAEQRRAARKTNRYFNVYLGVDVIPLLTSVEKMDFGGHMDLRGRRVAHSFGFSLVNQRRDFNSSSTRWDGNRYFYALKIFGKDPKSPTYSGFYLGYSDKTFETLPSITLTAKDGSGLRTMDLTPIDKQYELMWNSGVQGLGRGFGADFWFSLGASYNQLSFKELDQPDDYTFDNNDFFDSRDKLESIQFKMRMGISVGLNMGRKR